MARIQGLNKLQSRIMELQNDVPRNVDGVKKETVDSGHRVAIREVAVDTGELKSSIEKTDDSLGVGAEHGVFIEYGTFKMPAQPFIRPAYEDMKKYLGKNMRGVVK